MGCLSYQHAYEMKQCGWGCCHEFGSSLALEKKIRLANDVKLSVSWCLGMGYMGNGLVVQYEKHFPFPERFTSVDGSWKPYNNIELLQIFFPPDVFHDIY
ncbi:hypothetical protein HPP92_011031 [Vanilla planifolia]|uniref:Uncharacterized protein n=1 Tax=Vanilla planifolia TaxID=51239 RepID=A0A835V2G2_VANPL|nr:hypothetical protein HPP92_011031 [Vanilla planifolia]